MLAYCTALQVPVAWLIYAGGGKTSDARSRTRNIEVVAAPINLRQSPDEVLDRVRELSSGPLRVPTLHRFDRLDIRGHIRGAWRNM